MKLVIRVKKKQQQKTQNKPQPNLPNTVIQLDLIVTLFVASHVVCSSEP